MKLNLLLLSVVCFVYVTALPAAQSQYGRRMTQQTEEKLKKSGIDIEKRRSQMKRLVEARAKNLPQTETIAQQPKPLKKDENVIQLGDTIPEINERLGMAELLLEGDINPTEAHLEEIIRHAESMNDHSEGIKRAKRQLIVGDNYKWTNNVVYYTFASDFSQGKRDVVHQAIDYLTKRTCLSFVEDSTAENRILFINGAGCYSSVGMTGGEQTASIGDGCEAYSTVAHELTHALGSYHEQSRTDRDQFITINLNNVQVDQQYNYDIATDSANYNGYEYGSIMQYDAASFSTNGDIVMQTKNPDYFYTIGNSRNNTYYDVDMLNVQYKCYDLCQSSTTTCSNGGVPNPADCTVCNCPSGYSGPYCTDRPDGNGGQTLSATTSWQQYTAPMGATTDGSYITRVDWITAPMNNTIQVALTSPSEIFCVYGCTELGVEFQINSNQRETGVVNCCDTQLDHVYSSARNPTPVITYNRGYSSTFTIKYRYDLTHIIQERYRHSLNNNFHTSASRGLLCYFANSGMCYEIVGKIREGKAAI